MSVVRRRAELVSARKAAGHTQESLASALYVDRKTVVRWEAGQTTPWPYLWPKLARLLGLPRTHLHALFDSQTHQQPASMHILEFACDWLDRRAGWSSGTARRQVMSRIARLDKDRLRDRNAARGRVGRSDVVRTLAEYYGDCPDGFFLYSRQFGDQSIITSILTAHEWLNVRCRLTPDRDHLMVSSGTPSPGFALDRVAADAAVERLAEAAVLDVRLTDAQLYRLLDVDFDDGRLAGTAGLMPFAEYALTSDLLESEVLDALSTGTGEPHRGLALRDRFWPDLASVLDTRGRPCAGGVLALCAIARPADRHRLVLDYALLVQQRSDQVLNAPGQLAVIPKGFHQPLTDHHADAPVGASVRRELEEELFARSEVDNTRGPNRAADPMHPARLSAPLRWLTENDAVQTECTGFGFNLVSGNYEFASLVVIDDEEFWRRYGGSIEANWETAGLRVYSSSDLDGLARLVEDGAWSNEGLFAFLHGLQRLAERDPNRVTVRALGETNGGSR